MRIRTVTLNSSSGFTLLELLLAISILSIVSTVTYMSFTAVVDAWQKGMTMSDELHHADYVVEQLVMGLRSAYFPQAGGTSDEHGFRHEDNGDDAGFSDVISWVKLGNALVGADRSFAGTPHRVEFFVDSEGGDDSAAMIKAWRLYGLPDDFDPEELDPTLLATRITGFNCRMAEDTSDDIDLDDEELIDWLDEWEETNRLPTMIELTLYMDPLEEGGSPLMVQRVVEIPVSHLSWGTRSGSTRRSTSTSDGSDSGSSSGSGSRSSGPSEGKLSTGTP